MRRRTPMILIVLLSAILLTLSANGGAGEVQPIALEELRARMQAEEEMMLLNPQTDILFNEGHIRGSVNIPLSQVMVTDRLPQDKSALIVTYCQGRPKSLVSEQAAALLAARGYQNVRWFQEGTAGWAAAGYPLDYRDALPRLPVSGVEADQLKGRIQEFLVLDIRPPALYEMGWIRGSYRLPMDDLSQKYGDLPKEKKIVVVDDEGNQVILAARFLVQKGFEVLGLQGGMRSWVNRGYPVEK